MSFLFEQNPIANARLSNDKLDKFAGLHLEIITANKPVTEKTIYGVPVTTVFENMAIDTQSIYNKWKASVSLGATDKAEKEGRTISQNKAIKKFKTFVSRKEGVIADKYSDNPSVYEEFYPHGLTEYSTVTKKGADTVFKRFIDVLEIHKADFDPAVVAEGNDNYNIFIATKKAQAQKIGNVKDETSAASDLRVALELQLFKNLLSIVLINAEDPSKVQIYFDFSLLKRKSKKKSAVEATAVIK